MKISCLLMHRLGDSQCVMLNKRSQIPVLKPVCFYLGDIQGQAKLFRDRYLIGGFPGLREGQL